MLIAHHEKVLIDRLTTLSQSTSTSRQSMRVDGDFRPANRGERGAVTTESFLAAGLAAREQQVKAALVSLGMLDMGRRTQVTPGAFVLYEDEQGEEHSLIILPGGDGYRYKHIRVVSASAPLVVAMWMKEEGDEARFNGQDLTLLEVI